MSEYNNEEPLVIRSSAKPDRDSVPTIDASSTITGSRYDSVQGTILNAKDSALGSKPQKSEDEYQQKSVGMNYARALILASSVYFTGYYMGIMNPMGSVMAYQVFGMKTKPEMESFLGNTNLFLCMGATISFFCVGMIADLVGRIRLLIIVEFMSLIVVMGYFLKSILAFYFVRTLSGLVVGILSGLLPIILSEMFPSSITGVAGLFCYFSSTVFTLLGWLTPFMFDESQKDMGQHYRIIFIAPAFFGLPVLILTLFLFKFGAYESPTYFLNKIKPNSEKNRAVLIANLRRWLGVVYTPEDAELKIEELLFANNVVSDGYSKEGEQEDQGVMAMFSPRYRFRFMVVIMVNIFQQLSGINFLIFLSTQLFNALSGNGQTMTLIIGAMNIMGGVVGLLTISRFGRRFNMIYGVLIQIFGFSMLIIGYHYKNNVCAIIAVCSYMLSFAMGLGGTMPIFCAEILPATGVGIGGGIQWLFASILGKVLPILNLKIGPIWILAFFIAMMVITVFFINYACVETFGMTREDIEIIYKGKTTGEGKSHHFSWFKFGGGGKAQKVEGGQQLAKV